MTGNVLHEMLDRIPEFIEFCEENDVDYDISVKRCGKQVIGLSLRRQPTFAEDQEQDRMLEALEGDGK